MKVQIQKEVLYMAIATPIPRYDKTQLLLIDGKEIKLIDYLKELRQKNKITKKKISNLVKKNDYWYSQVERNGKKGDDNRQRTIYKPDLINIISIVKYNAQSSAELDAFREKSEIYLTKIIKATPLSESTKKLEWYEIHNNRTPEQQERLLSSLLATHDRLLRQAFNNMSGITDKDNFLNCLKNINTSLRIDPVFIVFLSGLPYADFLYETNQKDLYAFLRDIMQTLDSFSNEGLDSIDSKKQNYYSKLEAQISKYIHKTFMNIFTNRVELLPPDEIEF